MTESAWSAHNPNLQTAWDASSLASYQFCPRSYQLQNLEGWTTEKIDLEFGRLVAEGLERMKKAEIAGQTRDEALLAAVRWGLDATWSETDGEDEEPNQWGGHYETMWKCTGEKPYKNSKGNRAKCPFAFKEAWFPGDAPDICGSCGSAIHSGRRYIPDDGRKNRITFIRTLVWYSDDQSDDGYKPYVFPDGTPAVELSLRAPLPWKNRYGEDYILTANFDYLLNDGVFNFIVDNKTTTKTLNEQFYAGYSPSTQIDTYDVIGKTLLSSLNIKGVLIDAIQVMVEGVEFGKKPLYKNDELREEHMADMEHWIRRAEEDAERGYWPMNKSNCWKCGFKEVCSLAPSKRLAHLRANFQRQERWNPLKIR